MNIDTYLSYLRDVRRMSPNTIESYARDLAGLAAFAEKQGRDVVTLERRDLEAYVRSLMAAGLSPNQVRRGLQLFSPFLQRLEAFVQSLGIDSIVAEPLSYNNAIRYETYGFDYITGKQLMLWIDREFQPGGHLFRQRSGPLRLGRAKQRRVGFRCDLGVGVGGLLRGAVPGRKADRAAE